MLMPLTVWKTTGQVCCRLSLDLGLSCGSLMVRLVLWALGRRPQRWNALLIISHHIGALQWTRLITNDVNLDHLAKVPPYLTFPSFFPFVSIVSFLAALSLFYLLIIRLYCSISSAFRLPPHILPYATWVFAPMLLLLTRCVVETHPLPTEALMQSRFSCQREA